MKNIFLIKTDEPSRLCLDKDNNLLFAPNNGFFVEDDKHNLYIVSDEEIQ